VQGAYRHAIELVAGVAVAIFVAGVWLVRHERALERGPADDKTPQGSTPSGSV
jgi:hypothetical protein